MVEDAAVPKPQAQRTPRGTFKSGHKFGRGRAAGSRNRATLVLDKLADAEAEAVLRKVLEAAKNGDLRASELVLARIWAPRRGRPVRLELPEVQTAEEVASALAVAITAMAEGRITPEEAHSVAAVIEVRRKAIETQELADRVARLEQQRDRT